MSVLGTPVKHAGNRVEVRGSTVQVIDLDVPLEELAAYLREIPTEKRALAFVHAVKVGMTEILARRKRSDNGSLPVPTDGASTRPDPAEWTAHDGPEGATPGDEPILESRRLRSDEPSSAPRVDAGAERSGENRAELGRTRPESDGWLRRLDEEFDGIDGRQAIDARNLAAGVEVRLRSA